MMARELEGKVAIVTGGGRGIGRAIAEAYLAEGSSVVLTAAREKDEVEAVAARAANRCLPLLADVTRQEDCERVASETAKRFGGVDVLVNNAGTPPPSASARKVDERTEQGRGAIRPLRGQLPRAGPAGGGIGLRIGGPLRRRDGLRRGRGCHLPAPRPHGMVTSTPGDMRTRVLLTRAPRSRVAPPDA